MRLALLLGGVLALVALMGIARRGYRRWEVSGRSMLPALEPGDWLIVERVRPGGRPVQPGDIVLARDPRERARMLIKRVARVDDDGAWLLGDNPAESTDSRQFGPVALDEVVGRVRWRYWPARRVGRAG